MVSKHIILPAILFLCLSGISLAQNNFWVQTNGPTGGRVMSIAVDAAGKLYCGTQGGTLFQYSTIEQSWKPLFLGASRDNIISIVTDGNGYIYFATTNDGVFRCMEKSNSWERINTGLDDLKIGGLGILPDGTLLASTQSGFYKSVNKGADWVKIGPAGKPINAFVVHNNTIFVASRDSLLSYSTDGGQSWKKLQTQKDVTFRSVAIGSNGRIYAGTEKGDVFQYEKKYQRWKKIAHFNFGIWVLEADTEGNIYAALGGPAFSSEGGGIYLIPSTHEKPKLISSHAAWCMAIRNNIVYAGTAAGIYYSGKNRANWLPLNSGLIAQRVNDIAINKNDVVFVGSYGGVFRSHDDGATWIEKNKGLDEIGVVDMAINNRGDLFVGTYTSSIFRSLDSGNTWHKKSNGIPVKNSHWIMNLSINSRNEIFAAVLEAGVYRSLDNGETWHPVNNGLEKGRYNALVFDSKDVVFAANEKGNVFRSDNNGETWQKLEAKNPINDPPAELIVDSEDRLYFGAVEKGIFRYSKVDQMWVQLNNGLTNTTIRSLILTKEGLLFAGTSGAINYEKFAGDDLFYSNNKGESWSLKNSGLNHPRIKALAVNSKGILFAGTWGGGVYRSVSPVTFIK